MKKRSVDMQLHITVKSLAIFEEDINCKIDELIKNVKLLKEKEKKREKTNYWLKIISENLDDLEELFEQRKPLQKQIENLKKTEIDLMRE